MKKLLSLLFFTMLVVAVSFAQESFRGMKYQAVARDLKGEVLTDRKIELRINLKSSKDGVEQVFYSEVHNAVTNQLGLFNLVIGEGKAETGAFDKVPWSNSDIWMEVEIRMDGKVGFSTISNSQLLAVPYAFHALTAGEVIGNVIQGETGEKKFEWKDKCPCEQGISQVKVLYLGPTNVTIKVYDNKDLEPNHLIATFLNQANGAIITVNAPIPEGKLKNETYFQVVTPGMPVSEVPTSCDEQFVGENFGNFSVLSHKDKKNNSECTVCDVRMDWKLNGNAFGLLDLCNKIGTKSYTDLIFITNNIERFRITKDGAVDIKANLEIGEDLYVKRNLFLNTNQLTGGVGATLNYGPFTVDRMSPTYLTGILTVDKASVLKSSLDVTGTTLLRNTLTANGATTINNSLTVSKTDPGFVVSIINSDGDQGDGLKIQLGKTHPAWNNGSYLNTPSPSQIFDGPISTIRGWIFNHNAFNPSQLISFIPSTFQAALACNIVNLITDRLNSALHLPLEIGPYRVCFGELGCATVVPGFTLIPGIPLIDCSAFGLPAIDVPNISFVNVNNSLTNKNQFISFVDKDNRELGSIRAESVEDWSANYLDATYFVNLMAGLVGIDVINGIANAVAGFTNLAKSYNKIGVEYSSAHADYAEWLERTNPDEIISPGDIVGVRGGRVTKDLKGAEQILAVSHNPIVLGNAPPKEREALGNKIAFTGQVPVKVFGPVTVGDYIIGKGDIPGYGIAVKPENITTEDLKHTVGRSWETNLNEGPKMVNTLIGIDNGDYIRIMKESQDKISSLEMRLKTIEEKMEKILFGQELKDKNKRTGKVRN